MRPLMKFKEFFIIAETVMFIGRKRYVYDKCNGSGPIQTQFGVMVLELARYGNLGTFLYFSKLLSLLI